MPEVWEPTAPNGVFLDLELFDFQIQVSGTVRTSRPCQGGDPFDDCPQPIVRVLVFFEPMTLMPSFRQLILPLCRVMPARSGSRDRNRLHCTASLAPKILALPKILSLDFLSCMRVFSEIHWVFGRI